MLDSISKTAKGTIDLIDNIRLLMAKYKVAMRDQLPKIYSKDLLETLFKHPYTKIEHVQKDLQVSYDKARNSLEKLASKGLLIKQNVGKVSFYINPGLLNLFLPK
ncbi:Adenosine monophosphate-protein transferase SoFic [compost metagenome]